MSTTSLNATAAPLMLAEALIGFAGGYKALTLAAAVTLDVTYPSLLGLDPGGAARDVTLDAPVGQVRLIVNKADAAENLVVKNAAAATIATLNQNETGLFYGSRSDGWKLVALWTTALS